MTGKKLVKILAVVLCAFSLTVAFAGCGKGSNPSNENTEPVTGKFYTLQQAYENGFLTQDDLEIIAYYHNGEKPYPESINEDVAKSVKRDWAKKLADDETNPVEGATEDMFSIRKYYGTYNGCVAVTVERKGAMYPAVYNPVVVEIGNVVFNYSFYGPRITVWKVDGEITGQPVLVAGEFYTLQQAYENGFLTDDDVMHISYFISGEVNKIPEGADVMDTDKWEQIVFTPQKQLSELSEEIGNKIKEAFYSKYPDWFVGKNGEEIGNADDVILTNYGCYNGTYVVGIEFTFMGYGTAMLPVKVGGFVLGLNIPLVMAVKCCDSNQSETINIPLNVGYKLNYGSFVYDWCGNKIEQAEVIDSENGLVNYLNTKCKNNAENIIQEMTEVYGNAYFETKALIPTYFVSPFLLDTFDCMVWVTKYGENAVTVNVKYSVEAKDGVGVPDKIVSNIIFLEISKDFSQKLDNIFLKREYDDTLNCDTIII